MQKDESGEDWDDKDLAQNIVTRLLGKEQFFCGLWSTGNFEDKEVVFVDDENNKWEVTIDKYGGLEKITGYQPHRADFIGFGSVNRCPGHNKKTNRKQSQSHGEFH